MAKSPQLDDAFRWPVAEEIKAIQVQHNIVGSCNNNGLVINVNGKVILPEHANDIQLRICIVAHGGAAGHQGLKNTIDNVASHFWWPSLEADVDQFVRQCLQCASTRGGKIIARPFGEQLHATKPNEILHWDFLFLEPASDGIKYLLVVKDDASKYVRLFPCKDPDASAVFNCLLDWFAVFGICYTWITDQGSHFKNHVIASLQHALGAHHHFTTARCPWSNGTVEVVNRSVLRVFRALLAEWRMPTSDWTRLTPLVQLVINHTKLDSLNGEAPITCMMGLPAMSPVAPIVVNSDVQVATLSEIQELKAAEFNKLLADLENLHRSVAVVAKKNRGRKRAKIGAVLPNFDVGDFVLQATIHDTARSKLQVIWKGPSRVLRVLSNWVYEVEDIISKTVKEVHASRLKFYSDGSLNVCEDLMKQIAHSQDGHEVESFGEIRYDQESQAYHIEIKWRGLCEQENTWEPAANLMEDVPKPLTKYLKSRAKDPLVKQLVAAMEWQHLVRGK
jgi:hypothetical protein